MIQLVKLGAALAWLWTRLRQNSPGRGPPLTAPSSHLIWYDLIMYSGWPLRLTLVPDVLHCTGAVMLLRVPSLMLLLLLMLLLIVRYDVVWLTSYTPP